MRMICSYSWQKQAYPLRSIFSGIPLQLSYHIFVVRSWSEDAVNELQLMKFCMEYITCSDLRYVTGWRFFHCTFISLNRNHFRPHLIMCWRLHRIDWLRLHSRVALWLLEFPIFWECWIPHDNLKKPVEIYPLAEHHLPTSASQKNRAAGFFFEH